MLTQNPTVSGSNVSARIERLPVSRFTWRIIFLASFAWFIESLSIGSLGVVLPQIKAAMQLSAGATGLLTAASTFGIVLGLIPAGFMADRFGRKKVLVSGILVYSLLTLLCAFSGNYGMLLLFRFLSGLGMGAVFPIPYAIISEFVNSRKRTLFNGIMDACLSVGYFIAPLLGLLILPQFQTDTAWRVFFAISALPIFYAVIIQVFLPESPRWLAEKGRLSEANAVLRKMEAKIKNLCLEPLSPEIEPPVEPVRTSENLSIVSPWRKPYLRRTIARSFAATGTFFMFYIVMTYMPLLFSSTGFTFAHSLLFTAIITAAAIPGKLLNGYFAEKLGRKTVYLVFMGVAGIACLFFGLAKTPVAMLVYACLMSFAGTGAFPALKMSYAEQYPTFMRTTGAASVETVGRFLGGVVGSYVMPVILQDKGTAQGFYLIAIVVLAAIIIEAVFSPETKGCSLEKPEYKVALFGGL